MINLLLGTLVTLASAGVLETYELPKKVAETANIMAIEGVKVSICDENKNKILKADDRLSEKFKRPVFKIPAHTPVSIVIESAKIRTRSGALMCEEGLYFTPTANTNYLVEISGIKNPFAVDASNACKAGIKKFESNPEKSVEVEADFLVPCTERGAKFLKESGIKDEIEGMLKDFQELKKKTVSPK